MISKYFSNGYFTSQHLWEVSQQNLSIFLLT